MKKQSIFPVSLFFGLFLLMACQEPSNHGPKDTENFPPEELIAANIQETRASLSMVFKNIEINRAPSDNDIYGEWKIQAMVNRCFQGDLNPGDPFVFYWHFEKGSEPPKVETMYIGSFNRNEKGDYYVPDNAYVFEYSQTLENMFARATAKKSK